MNKTQIFLKKIKKREEKHLIRISKLRKYLVKKSNLARSNKLSLILRKKILLIISNKIKLINKSNLKLKVKG